MENLRDASVDELLKAGIQAAKSGNKDVAQAIFRQVLEQDKDNERALFWMASVVNTLEEKRLYLRATLKVNPGNVKAKKYLQKINEASSFRDSQIAKYGLIAAGVLVLLFIVAIIVVVVLT